MQAKSATHVQSDQLLTRIDGATTVDAAAAKRELEIPFDPNASGVGLAAPFTEEDSHNGKNQVLSPGQEITIVLKDRPGRTWADGIADNAYFQQLSATKHGDTHVYRVRVNGDALRWHQGTKQVPAALSIYAMAPGESYRTRSTRGDGSGPEFYLNTVILNEKKMSPIGVRCGKTDQSEAKTLELGELEKPGAVLGNTTQELRPGDTLQFSARINQIWGIGEITVTPAGALDVQSKLLEDRTHGAAGETLLYQWSFKVPESAEPGSTIELKTSGHWQVRDDPNWAFSFQVKVA
jgi:hypothetical protein